MIDALKRMRPETPKAKQKEDTTDELLEKFKEWFEKLFDWIEVRLKRLQWKMDLYTKKADNAVGYEAKNKQLNKAAKTISGVNGQESYQLQTTVGADGVERVTGISIGNAGKKGTMINNNLRGAKRYFQQADEVRQKAVSTGIISSAKANEVIAKIQSGEIDINEYDERTREFIKDYQEYYDKALESVSAVEDLKSEFKDIQQTKLDNITQQFNAITGIMEAQREIAKTIMQYYQVIGTAVNSPTMVSSLQTQMAMTQNMMGAYQEAYSAYSNELQNAAEVYGTDSVEYANAQLELVNIEASYANAQLTLAELND
jgi:hypothetical protein